MKTKRRPRALVWSIAPKTLKIRVCPYCADPFLSINGGQRHCSEFCRFWSKVDYGDGMECWLWTGGTENEGYGIFDSYRAHRHSWRTQKGEIPIGLFVCHSCDTPGCVRPSHLWLGTEAENKEDRDAKGRGTAGERNGRAKLTTETVIEIRRSPLNGQQLADKLGLHRSTINKIRAEQYWKHVRSAATALALIAVVFLQGCDASGNRPLSGHPRVLDGDTIAFGNTRVRLFGIDSPELDQPCVDTSGVRWFCGVVAKQAMSSILEGKAVSCDQKDIDRYGRIVAICYLDSFGSVSRIDIGGEMVLRGWAINYQRYSHGLYLEQQKIAQDNKRGIWRSGWFEQPEHWRHTHERPR